MHIYMYLVAFNVGAFDIIVVASFNIPIYKITEIVRVIWLVKNLWFIIPVNP